MVPSRLRFLVRPSAIPPAAYGPVGAGPGPEQLSVQPIRDGRGQGSRPSSLGDRLGDEGVANLGRMGVADRPFWRCDGHALDALDVLGGKVGIVLENSPSVPRQHVARVDQKAAHLGRCTSRGPGPR